MSQHSSLRTRLELNPMEDRSTPSANFGDHWNHGKHHSHAPVAAQVAHHGQHSVPISLSSHITSDGTGNLTLSGVGTFLGHWTGQGVVEDLDIDEAAGQVTANGTFTMRAKNGDRLFGDFSISLNLTTGHGDELITFTGGTGRFAGVTGTVTQTCETNWDPASPLNFVCDAQGTGNLVFGDSQSDGKHEKTQDEKHEKTPDVKHEKTPDVKHEKTPVVKQMK